MTESKIRGLADCLRAGRIVPPVPDVVVMDYANDPITRALGRLSRSQMTIDNFRGEVLRSF